MEQGTGRDDEEGGSFERSQGFWSSRKEEEAEH